MPDPIKLEPPETIYLQWYGAGGDPEDGGPQRTEDVSWCQDRISEHDIEYARVEPESVNAELLAKRVNELEAALREISPAIHYIVNWDEDDDPRCRFINSIVSNALSRAKGAK